MEILKKVEKLEPAGYICDICGGSCNLSKDPRFEDHEHAVLLARWGWSSKSDGDVHQCHMCEGCYEKVAEFIRSLGGKVRVIEDVHVLNWEKSHRKEGVDYIIRP